MNVHSYDKARCKKASFPGQLLSQNYTVSFKLLFTVCRLAQDRGVARSATPDMVLLHKFGIIAGGGGGGRQQGQMLDPSHAVNCKLTARHDTSKQAHHCQRKWKKHQSKPDSFLSLVCFVSPKNNLFCPQQYHFLIYQQMMEVQQVILYSLCMQPHLSYTNPVHIKTTQPSQQLASTYHPPFYKETKNPHGEIATAPCHVPLRDFWASTSLSFPAVSTHFYLALHDTSTRSSVNPNPPPLTYSPVVGDKTERNWYSCRSIWFKSASFEHRKPWLEQSLPAPSPCQQSSNKEQSTKSSNSHPMNTYRRTRFSIHKTC